jgi:hypothetical protein
MSNKVGFVAHSHRFAGLFTADVQYNLTCKLQGTMLLKLGSHYNLPISMHCVFEIGVSTIKAAGSKNPAAYINEKRRNLCHTEDVMFLPVVWY